MQKRIEDLKVVENKWLNEEFFTLKLQSNSSLPDIFPGQFAELLVTGSPSTFLRRPISIYDVDYATNSFQLLIKIVGDGSRKLSELANGDILNIIYPLGNHFSKPNGKNVLLIGGGTGVAPMLILGKYLKEKLKITPNFLLGFRNSDLIIEQDRFSEVGKVYLTTEDGSFGHKGFVIDHPILQSSDIQFDMIYTCGPEVMMKEVAKYAHNKNISCEVSLENLMGCGFGACLCCIVETVDEGNVNTCTEGPIFNSKRLKWLI